MIFAFRRCFSSRFFFMSSMRNKSVIVIRMITSAAIVITAVYSRFCDLFIV